MCVGSVPSRGSKPVQNAPKHPHPRVLPVFGDLVAPECWEGTSEGMLCAVPVMQSHRSRLLSHGTEVGATPQAALHPTSQHRIPHPGMAPGAATPPPGWRHSHTCSPLAGDAINMRGALLIELLNTAAGHRNSSVLRFHPKLDWNSQTGTL